MTTTRLTIALLVVTLVATTGCQQTIQPPTPAVSNDPLVTVHEADLQRSTEVQMVEQMALYRTNYFQCLEQLRKFYDQQGNHQKASWAQTELDYLKQGPLRDYLVVAETASPDLHASTAILEADLLFDEARLLALEGGGKVGKLFMDKTKLYLAIDKFNQLITDYPNSDKIDDASFAIAQIYHHQLADYTTALLYYQRVWQWDPQTTLPVRFAVATLYDEKLHNRTQALRFYQQALDLEPNYPANSVHAKNRIEALNKELQQH